MNITNALTDRSLETPDAPAILTPDSTLSYQELERAVSWTANSFRKAGLAAGEIAGIDLSSGTQHLVAALALARLGIGQIAFDNMDPPALRDDFVKRLGVAAIISNDTGDLNAPVSTIIPPPADTRDLKQLEPMAVEASDDGALPFLIMRTSGTSTGWPKIGIISHAMALPRINTKGFKLPHGSGCRYMSLGRLSYNSVKHRAFHCVLSGGCLVFTDGLSGAPSLVDFINGHGIDYLSCAPYQARPLLDLASEENVLLPGLKALRLGSTFVPQVVRESIREHLTPNLYIAYGIGEIGTVAVAPPELVRDIPGVVGILAPDIQAEAIDDDEHLLTAGARGRLRLKAPGMIAGYMDSPEESAHAFRNGWFYSDDIVEFTVDRLLIHHGRADDMIIFDGINISPAEIENILLQHPAVSDAAVVPLRSDSHGDAPIAVVSIEKDATGDELLSYCLSRLGPHAPEHVMIVDRLPRNAAGKIHKNDLRKTISKNLAPWRAP